MKEKLTPENIRVEYLQDINYAIATNGGKFLNTCEITNDDNEDWREVSVSLSGEFLAASESRIELIPQGQMVAVSNLAIHPDIEKLRKVTESVETQFELKVMISGQDVFCQSYPLHIMAFDQWPGIKVMPEILASFVTPNASGLAEVRLEAARQLDRLTGSSALDDYQTQDPNRVRAQVAAVYEALREQGIVYVSVPPSFEETGQRVRLPDQVLAEKQGTCLDLSLTFAACLESIGLNTMLIIIKEHMFVGCWLDNLYYPQMFCDDVSFLSKATADGINELVVVETTQITQKNVSFEQAVTMAEDHIKLKPELFYLAVDIKRCRLYNIRPLPLGTEGAANLEGIQLDHATDNVRELRQYDINTQEDRHLTRLQIWERKLLDFSLRNNLLNMRIGKKVVPFVSFNLEELEDLLQAKKDFKIMPFPLGKAPAPDDTGIFNSRAHRDAMEAMVLEGIKHNQIYSFCMEDELGTALKGLFRSSRTALEENGANTLFLVLGLLKWYETDKSIKPRYAPLLLEPVDIVKKSGNNYVLRVREEDITFNTTLVEMMIQQYDVNMSSISPLPYDDSGVDVRQVFSVVRACIKDHARWDVVEESLLGLFSFSKFVMWNDIHNNAQKLRENPVVESLIQKRLVNIQEPSTTDTRQVDKTVEPGHYAIPVDVDSSQLEAVIESGEGRSFILYGPPGTGKSQTITNMISNALYHGRRVLFVAEKMAALEVVQKRLKKIGLDPFCLEMHSNKMTKTHLLTQLQTALDITRIKTPEEYEKESKALFDERQRLIRYVTLLHEKQPSGLSLHDYISRYTALGPGDSITPTEKFIEGINAQRIADTEKFIRELGAVFGITGLPHEHPLYGLLIMDPSYDAQQKAASFVEQTAKYAPNARNAIREISRINGLSIAENPVGMQLAEEFVDAVSATPAISADIFRIASEPSLRQDWLQLVETGKRLDQVKASLVSNYDPQVLQLDVLRLKTDWANVCDKWAVSRFFAKKKFVSQLKGYRRDISADHIESLISQREQYRQFQQTLAPRQEELSRIFGSLITSGQVQWDRIAESIQRAPAILALLRGTNMPASYMPPVNKEGTQSIDISALRQINALWKSTTVCSIDARLTLEEIMQKTPQWLVHINKSRDWSQWCVRRAQLMSQRLGGVANYIEKGHDPEAACQSMLRGVYRKLAMDVIDQSSELRVFNGMIFEDAIKHYRDIAKQFQELTKKALYCKLASRIPSLTIEAARGSEIGTLKRLIKSGGRGTTIRQIIDQIPTLLPKLCPCMLMSPISVAQFIDLNQEQFDIVVFDEASQMPTSEAVGAIARGKALIVVGDPKQMPPTSFFMTTSVDEAEADNDDMESILDDCITLSFPDHYLTWHYRSRHESLIAFSNSQYYDGKLYTFPSVDDRQSKVAFVPINGTYDMGKTRCNRAEAEAIVQEVIRRLRDSKLSKNSIGIVSFSKVQQDLIEDILVDELSKDPALERLAYDCEEPIFVKNLENVQGDERDVILFSVGYGPDKSGHVSMNFGPLNNAGGERRLNVAVSRARTEMMVFSTLQPEQIDLNRSRARGVEGLKRFLEFARSGRMPVISSQLEEKADTSIIDAIAAEIRLNGYEVDTLVGRSRFKIDLAVIDPANPDNYLMGIICDGANYNRTNTQRDREICQPGVLQGLGWNLMRVWAVDWFLNPEKVIDRIVDELDKIKAAHEAPQPAKEQPVLKAAPAPEKKPQPQPVSAPTPAATTSGSPKVGTAAPTADRISAIPFEVKEDEIIKENVDDKRVSYQAAMIAQRYRNMTPEGLSLNRRLLDADIKQIIAIEQPVTLGTITKRIMSIYGMTRTSDRLRHVMDKSLERAYIDPMSLPENPAYWTDENAAKGYDKYRVASNRDIDDIPSIEIKNAIVLAMSQQLSVPVAELQKQIANMFGFGRRTSKTDQAIDRVLQYLVDHQVVSIHDGNVMIVEGRK